MKQTNQANRLDTEPGCSFLILLFAFLLTLVVNIYQLCKARDMQQQLDRESAISVKSGGDR